MARIPTVKIAADGGYAIINEDDFDAESMELYEAPEVDELAEMLARVGAMKKPDLIEALESHGAETDGKVDDLKERLASIEAELLEDE